MAEDTLLSKVGKLIPLDSGRQLRSLSFAAVWLWCCIVSRRGLFPAFAEGGELFANLSLPMLAFNILGLVVIVILSKRLVTILDLRSIMFVTTLVFLTGSSLLVVAQERDSFVLGCVGLACGGFCIAALKIAWGEMFSRMSLEEGLACMAWALLVSVSFFLLTWFLPVVLLRVVFIASGTVCAPLLYWGTRAMTGTEERCVAQRQRPLKNSWTFIMLPMLVAFTCGVSFGIHIVDLSALTDTNVVAMAVGEGIVGVALLVISRRLSLGFGAAQIFAMSLIFVIIGYLLSAFGFGATWFAIAINSIGFHAFYFFIIVFWGDLAKRMNRSVIVTYATGYFAFQLAQLLGYFCELFVMRSIGSSFAILLTMGIVLAFFVGALFLYGGPHSQVRAWLIADGIQETSNEFSEACMRITNLYALSPREHEIVLLLARGRNALYIAEALYIASSTVKTHIKSIYRKLDIHSQQDLMRLIDQSMS
jgi:DNA-binding CsgD family transcriptional regulator